jgi:hypothetical protein
MTPGIQRFLKIEFPPTKIININKKLS